MVYTYLDLLRKANHKGYTPDPNPDPDPNLNMFGKEDPPEYFFNEEKATRAMEFRYLEADDSFSYAERLAGQMLWPGLKPAEVLIHDYNWGRFDSEEIQKDVLAWLRPENMIVVLSSPPRDGLLSKKPLPLEEEWFRVKYRTEATNQHTPS